MFYNLSTLFCINLMNFNFFNMTTKKQGISGTRYSIYILVMQSRFVPMYTYYGNRRIFCTPIHLLPSQNRKERKYP